MDNHLSALLIRELPEPFQALQGALSDLSVESYPARGCNEAASLVVRYQPPVVFADLPIWRQSHAEIVNMANAANRTFNIIVVGPLPDIEQYMSAIERGAFNFVAPPFSHDTLTLAVHSAAMDARERRESLERVLLSIAAKV